jgi:hypothetical protein
VESSDHPFEARDVEDVGELARLDFERALSGWCDLVIPPPRIRIGVLRVASRLADQAYLQVPLVTAAG